MPAQIPEQVAESDLSRLLGRYLKRIHQGKVRDTYELPGYPDLLLVVATDRLSIFDFVLPCLVNHKGAILTDITIHWLLGKIKDFDNHLVDYGWMIDDYLPLNLRGNKELFLRSIVVRRLKIFPVECVVRGYLTGSGWTSYKATGMVCGHKLPEGLYDGAELPYPIFTPTTKAETGHDEPIDAKLIDPKFEKISLAIYNAAAKHTPEHGIILADTKFEFDENGILADEVVTPDSSRFWDAKDWENATAQKEAPAGFDKEPVRQWGKTVPTPFGVTGINKLDPSNPEHIKFVHSLKIPLEVTGATSRRYWAIRRRLLIG